MKLNSPAAKTVTYDFERLMPGSTKLKCSEFADAMIKHREVARLH